MFSFFVRVYSFLLLWKFCDPSGSRVDQGCKLNQPSVWDEGPGRHILWYSVTLASCKIFVRKIVTNCIWAPYSARSWSVWEALWTVSQAHIMSRLTYACSAWWGFCNSGERDQLAAVVTRLAKKNYLPPDQPTLHEMVATADVQLFNTVVADPTHVLAPLIPLSKSHSYNLRKRPHDLQIPSHKTNILDKNFITRTILALNHTWTELCRLMIHLNYCKFAIVCLFFVLSVRAVCDC